MNSMNLSRVSNPPKKPVLIERRLKSWNIEYNFKWNQPYLIRVLNLSRGSNSLNSASDGFKLKTCIFKLPFLLDFSSLQSGGTNMTGSLQHNYSNIQTGISAPSSIISAVSLY